jgi:hypothetical protein
LYCRADSDAGRAIVGLASSLTGTTYGVYGHSNSNAGRGVYGKASLGASTTYGVYGHSNSDGGTGVYGNASQATGTTYGVYGLSDSNAGTGVYGNASQTTGTTYGVYGRSNSPNGKGVSGIATATTGPSYGGYFQTPSGSGIAVYGEATATTGYTYGVYGKANSTDGYAVYYEGDIGGTGLMRSLVQTSRGRTALDAHTTAGSWVEDFGEGRLVSGRSRVDLDPVFLETVSIDENNPMKVFVQLHDEDCKGVAVKKGTTGFEVIELWKGTSSSTFDYRVVAKRRGFEDKRLEVCGAARGNPYLRRELRKATGHIYNMNRDRIEK